MRPRRMSAALLLGAAIGCSSAPAGPAADETPAPAVAPDAFTGAWRSVTPSLEFVRLTVVSKSSEQGVLGARLTLSGLAWDGGGRIDGDSLVAAMAVSGSTQASGRLVARASDARTLRVQMHSSSAAAPLALTFVREE